MKKSRKRIISILGFLLVICLSIWLYSGIRGQIITINNFSEDERRRISEAYNIDFENENIESFQYMIYARESFFVLKISNENSKDFFDKNKSLGTPQNLDSGFSLFPTKKYKPSDNIYTVYTDDQYIYISIWRYQSKEVSNLFDNLNEFEFDGITDSSLHTAYLYAYLYYNSILAIA